MDEDKITKIALEAGLLNYIDNETPRRYFINGHADLEEVEKFAELIVRECMSYMEDGDIDFAKFMIRKHFGVKE